MTRYLIALFTFLQLSAISQTTIFSDSGESYNGSNGVTTDTYPDIDISNCTSISISLDFEFSLPWEGDGNMEICTDCPIPCGCDIEFPTAGGCTPCWDFLYVQFSIDGSEIFSDLIGDAGTTDADQFGSMNSGLICTDGASNADILVQTQTWAGNETVTFSNIVVVCYEATPIDIEYTPECEGSDIELTAQAQSNTHVTTWAWGTNGTGIFAPNNSQNTTYSNGSNGDEITVETEDPNGCTEEYTETLMYSDPPTASIDQTGNGDLCIGDCTNISVIFDGGTPPYNIDFGLSVVGLPPVNIPLPGFGVNDVVTVCFDGTGLFPSVNGNTVTVPEIATGAFGELTINSFEDDNGCMGIIEGTGFTLNFLSTPQAFPAMMEMCEENSGEATFDFNEIESTINAGTGFDVNYWFDSDATLAISSPFTTSTTTVFATVDNGSCTSPAVPITLTVLPEGDAGQVLFSCSDSGSVDCIICDANGDGQEEVTLYFFFPNGGNNEVEVLVNNSTTFIGSYSGQFAQENYTITGPTTFEIIRITPLGQCPDESDLGQVVNVTLLESPDIDPIPSIVQCGSYTLPEITGSNLSGSQAYYTLPKGEGLRFNAGQIVTSSVSLFAFDGNIDCFDEEIISITIEGLSIDNTDPLIDCDTVFLPAITGTDLTGNEAYYSEPNGVGDIYMVGDTITVSDTLFAYDSNGDCSSQDSIIIIIHPGLQAGVGDSINYCVSQNLIINLPALLTVPADTAGLWQDNMGIIQENTDSTMVDMGSFQGEVIFQYIIQNENCGPDTSVLVVNIANQLFAGNDVDITTCAGSFNSPLNLINEFSSASSIGLFQTTSTDIDLINPSSVNINSLTPGNYVIQHILLDEGECLGDTALFNLTITDEPIVDFPGSVLICDGQSTDLMDLGTITGGSISFIDPSNTGALTGSIFNAANVSPGTYTIDYSFIVNQPCPASEINNSINVIVESIDSAGEDQSYTYCEPQSVFLLQQIDNAASNNGIFIESSTSTVIDPSPYSFDNIGTYEIWYVVDNAPNCPPDTATLTFEILSPPSVEINIMQESICIGSSINTVFNYPNSNADSAYLAYYSTSMINNNEAPDTVKLDLNFGTGEVNLQNTVIPNITIDFSAGDYLYYEVISFKDNQCNYNIDGVIDSVLVSDINTTFISGPICMSESVTVGTEIFDINNPTGEVLFPMPLACDSLVVVALQFLENPVEDLLLTACAGDTISIGTLNLTVDNNSGSTTMYGQASNGCDSTINVVVEFSNSVTFNVDKLLCAGVTEEYNGVVYDINNPIGIDTIVGGSVSGCDSIISVNLDFYPPNIVNLNQELCNGQSIQVNGVTYDLNNPTGVETLVDQNGCDSTVNVSLTFVEEIGSIIDDEICQGQTITVNGNTYDANTPSGMETMTSVAGCDSVITIDLTIVETLSSNLDSTLCQNQSLVLNGTTYDAGNPSGTESLVSSAGCDSIVIVNLSFVDAITTNLDSTLCLNQSLVVNGNTYDSNNPSGTESFTSVAGCDSIVSINLTFTETINTNLDSTLCLNQSLVVNGNTYDSNNPSGTESFTSTAGCDSIVNINLNFVESFTTDIDTVLCAEESLIINNTIYDINNLSGVETFTSVAGCDSTVNINLTFEETTFDVSTNNPCPGEAGIISISNIQGVGPYTYTLNGTTMDIQGNEASISSTELSGEIILADANNCTYGVSYNITPANSFEIDYSLNGNVITITGITNDDISNIAWIPAEGLNCSDCLEVTTNSSEAIEYNVEITTMDGCIYSLTIPFAPEPVIEIPDYYTPNVFSPNNDGNNDVFSIVPGKFANKLIPSMRIFDRWGNLVFELNNFEAQPGIGWDGRYKGEYVNPGVYVFTFEVINNGQMEVRFGDVTVIR